MTSVLYRFGDFELDPNNRQLTCKNQELEINARYFDALHLLVARSQELVSKSEFFEKVWQQRVVTDEALTQCIRTLRKLLNDKATRPQFIETVPKHGYRFIANVKKVSPPDLVNAKIPASLLRQRLFIAGAGTIGAGIAGLIGGSTYGLLAISNLSNDVDAFKFWLIIVCITELMALIGGAAVAFGVAFSLFWNQLPRQMTIMGGACGGLLIGSLFHWLSIEVFKIFLSQEPVQSAGALEGLLLGAATGACLWLSLKDYKRRYLTMFISASILSVITGLTITLLDGNLMVSSLVSLSEIMSTSEFINNFESKNNASINGYAHVLINSFESLLFVLCVTFSMKQSYNQLAQKN